ncbi:MAG: glycosyltransferase family 2 protein [Rhodobacteraceae bacterium]|nr:glycosyltransferase family 2 protein [Paracoccaceae bacterium]
MRCDVAVVIVNYRTADMVIAAVDSVLGRGDDGLAVEVHVVDNASPGDDAAALRRAAERWGPAVTLYLETVNHGFGRGNNLVLRALAARAEPPPKVYLLNPDARLVNNAIAELSAFLDAHPRAAVAGSRILDGTAGAPAVSAFRFPGLASEFAGALHFGPVSRLVAPWMVALPPELPEHRVDWVSGASMMARLDALTEVGLFDPDFFLYYEEVDLMRRLSRQGWEVWHVPTAVVAHVGGASTGVSSTRPEPPPLPSYWFDSWRLYFEKAYGRGRARLIALARLAGTALGDLQCRLRGKPLRNPRNFVADFRRHVLAPLFGRKAAGAGP